METYTVMLIVIICLGLVLTKLENRRTSGKRIGDKVRESYGKIPSPGEVDFSLLEYSWVFDREKVPEHEQIDEITWNDLDMDSVFCRIDSCQSFAGQQVLYGALHCQAKAEEQGERLKEKILFFAQNEEERQRVMMILARLGKGRDSYYLPAFVHNLKGFEIPNIRFYHMMRALLFLSLIPAAVLLQSQLLVLTLFAAMANLTIYSFQKYKYSVNLSMLRSVLGIVRTARQISDGGKSGYEARFRDLADLARPFERAILKMAKLQRRDQEGLAGDMFSMLGAYFIGVTLSDFIQYNQLLKELNGKQQELLELYHRVGEVDMSIAAASFRASLPHWCVPETVRSGGIQVEDIYHPLIKDPVCNSVTLERGCLITGSNASGKSTFIKSLAVNVLLAQSICTCAAGRMRLPASSLVTSMAVRDDVTSGESYYIKEIKYLKRIIRQLDSERFTICVIDEILRGTNTQERIAASCAVLKYLAGQNCLAVTASHDIELTQLLADYYDNYHFREQMEENGISYTYKIQPGPADSKNAIRLLEIMGFPGEIVEEARMVTRTWAGVMDGT